MARKTAVEDDDGLWIGFYNSSPQKQKERTEAWLKAQKAVDKLSKKRDRNAR